MASRYPSAWMDELRSRSDIVQVVSGYVSLKKNGRKHWGLCPFHGEKTASFSVDGEHQLFYCFGCKAGGDVIHFVMEIERLSFPEAVQLLAERAHMAMPEMENDADYEMRRSRRERMYAANREAARFYHEMLFRPEGREVLSYLRDRRGLSDRVIRKFGLGAAPEEWSRLTDHLLNQGFTLEELAGAGLTVVKTPETDSGKIHSFDMFRHRAMFPIIDMYKNVIAFGGRNLDKQEPKYLNTADTPVFNKRKGVYAANLLRQQRHLDRVVLVEGYMDVVSLAQFGVEGVCATLGTALTPEQAQLLRRFAPMVYLGYDGDSAGQNAILRGLEIFEKEGVPVRVLDFPDGLDPDEFVRRDGAEGFRKLPVLTPAAYRLRRLRAESDLSSPDGRIAFAREAARILAPLDPVERETHLRSLSVETGFSREILMEQIQSVKPPEETDAVPRRPAVKTPRSPEAGQAPVSEDIRAQEMLLSLLASGQIPKDIVEEKDFGDDELKSIYANLLAGMSPAALVSAAPDDASRSRFTRILLTPAARDTDEMIAMARDCVNRIRRTALEKRLKELSDQVDRLSGDEASAAIKEAQEISMQLNRYA